MQTLWNGATLYEVVKALCSLPILPNYPIKPAVDFLVQNLNESNTVNRFTAMNCLHQLSLVYPTAITSSIMAVEKVVTDVNP